MNPQTSKAWTLPKLRKETLRAFQKYIRASYGACVRNELAIVDGKPMEIFSPLGFCVCVTCGNVVPWSAPRSLGEAGADAGHFLSSRPGSDSTAFLHCNCHPQCVYCNDKRNGAAADYERYVVKRYGTWFPDAIRWVDKSINDPLSREQLELMRSMYHDGANRAIAIMRAN